MPDIIITKRYLEDNAGFVHLDAPGKYTITMPDGLARATYNYMLLHEQGHIFRQHLEARQKLPYLQQELEADAYALAHGASAAAAIEYLSRYMRGTNLFQDKQIEARIAAIRSGSYELPNFTHYCVHCKMHMEESDLIWEDAWTPTCPNCYTADMIEELK